MGQTFVFFRVTSGRNDDDVVFLSRDTCRGMHAELLMIVASGKPMVRRTLYFQPLLLCLTRRFARVSSRRKNTQNRERLDSESTTSTTQTLKPWPAVRLFLVATRPPRPIISSILAWAGIKTTNQPPQLAPVEQNCESEECLDP